MSRPVLPLQERCPVCASSQANSVLHHDNFTTNCHRLARTAAEALHLTRGTLDLCHCGNCHVLYNRAFDPTKVRYDECYENAQHFSARFRKYLTELSDRLVANHGLVRKTIVEIGCGDGRFLKALCQHSKNRGLGFDPAAPSNHRSAANVEIHPRLFGDEDESLAADLIVARHVLEHIPEPVDFIQRVRRVLAVRRGSVYLEVPSGDHMLRSGAFWDLLYEHCVYFTRSSLEYLLKRAGFSDIQTREQFGGQFLSVEARVSHASRSSIDGEGQSCEPQSAPSHSRVAAREANERNKTAAELSRFGDAYRKTVNHWNERLEQWGKQKKKVLVWGAGTKGIMFANHLENTQNICATVDINPRKWGHHMAGTGIPIVSQNDEIVKQADIVLIMNCIYEAEIREHFADCGQLPFFTCV